MIAGSPATLDYGECVFVLTTIKGERTKVAEIPIAVTFADPLHRTAHQHGVAVSESGGNGLAQELKAISADVPKGQGCPSGTTAQLPSPVILMRVGETLRGGAEASHPD